VTVQSVVALISVYQTGETSSACFLKNSHKIIELPVYYHLLRWRTTCLCELYT